MRLRKRCYIRRHIILQADGKTHRSEHQEFETIAISKIQYTITPDLLKFLLSFTSWKEAVLLGSDFLLKNNYWLTLHQGLLHPEDMKTAHLKLAHKKLITYNKVDEEPWKSFIAMMEKELHKRQAEDLSKDITGDLKNNDA